MSLATEAAHALGCPPIDPEGCTLTWHAIGRYAARRKGATVQWAENGLRRLLARAADQPMPPLEYRQGRLGRRYTVGDICLVLSADNGTVITIYPLDPRRRRI